MISTSCIAYGAEHSLCGSHANVAVSRLPLQCSESDTKTDRVAQVEVWKRRSFLWKFTHGLTLM